MPTSTGKATDLITFSRGTLATVVDSDGKVKWAPHNLLSASEQFDASVWGKYLATVSANTQVAPNGTTTADTITALSGNDVHRVQRSSDVAIGAPANCSFSIFVKAGTHNFVTIGFYSASEVFVSATFNLASGSVATETDVGTTSGTVVSTEKVDVGNSWFRLSITGNYSGSSALSFVNFAQAATGNSYTNFGQPVANLVGTETFHLWGAHLYRSDLGGMQANASAYPMYNPSTPKNLLGYSEDFSNAAWSKPGILAFGSGSTINATAAPNGSLSADLLTESTSTGFHSVYQSFTCVSNTPYVFAGYVKPNGRTIVRIAAQATGNIHIVEFTLSGAGSFVTRSGSGTAAITALDNGWYRISTISTATGSGTGYWQIDMCSAANTNSYTGDGTSGIYLWGAQLSDSASLDAYSPVFGAAPSAAAYHGPRLDYDPVTLACKGLLVEEQRTNLCLNSSDLNGTGWQKLASGTGSVPVVTSNYSSVIAPDGKASASRVQFNRGAGTTSSDVSRMFQEITDPASGVGTMSVWLRSTDGASTYSLELYNGNAAAQITVTGAWVRYTLVSTNTSVNFQIRIVGDYGASSTADIVVWGAQLEAGSFATSYIPTAAATVTRNADVASVATSAFPYSATEGTVVANFMPLFVSTANVIFNLGAGLDSNSLYSTSGPSQNLVVRSAGSTTVLLSAGGFTVGQASKLGAAFKSSDYAVVTNGGTVATVGSGALPTGSATTFALGGGAPLTGGANGHIRQITYLPRRISNAELQQRTA